MRKSDTQLGTPYTEYKDTKANIEALASPVEGMIAYATDTNQSGSYNGAAWDWNAVTSGTLAQFAATTSAQLAGVLSDETGTGAAVFATSPTLVTPLLGTPTSGVMTNVTGLPLTTGVTGVLPAANGGTGIDNSTRTLTISTNAGTISFSAGASTLTVPATGTAGLLGATQEWTGVNTFNSNSVSITGATNPTLFLAEGGGTSYFSIEQTQATQSKIKHYNAGAGVAIIDIDPDPTDGTSASSFRFFRNITTTGRASFIIYNGIAASSKTNHDISGNGYTIFSASYGNTSIGYSAAAPVSTFQTGQRTAGAGTVSTVGTTALTGVGTDFQNELKVGDTITVSGETVRTIATISSATALTVTVAFSNTASGLTYTTPGGIRFFVKGNGLISLGVATTDRVFSPALATMSAINYAADAQANDTYVITLDPPLTAYTTGLEIKFKANTANTGAATLNVNGLGAKTIVKAVSTTLANNDILASMICLVVYDGTNFVLMNPRVL